MIVHGDALTFPLEAFDGIDVMITDPPYSEHVHSNAASAGTMGDLSKGWHNRDLGFAHLSPALRMRIAEIGRRVKRWSVVFSDLESQGAWRADFSIAKVDYIRQEIWTRWSQPQKSGDRPGSFNEAILVYHNAGAKHWNGPGSRMSYTRKCLRGDAKHPTEKPLDLMLDLVSAYSDPAETVVDPCGGAGTTALACALLGRECLSIEANPEWCAVAERRVSMSAWLPRDLDRAREWCESYAEEANRVPTPKAADGSDRKTWERAQRRIRDVAHVQERLP